MCTLRTRDAALSLAGRARERRERRRRLASLWRAARATATDTETPPAAPSDREPAPDADLPAPVRRYFARVLPANTSPLRSVRLEQTGELRVGGPGSRWLPFTATQHVTTDPPGFLWDAAVRLAPLLSVRVLDSLCDGAASARVSLAGVLPLGGAAPGPELNEATLLRYLAEAVWYPTALLPGAGVEWAAVDDQTARATLACGDASASLRFSFDDADRVCRVHAPERHRRVDGGFEPTPWSGYWRAYRSRDGVSVPHEGEAVWHLPDGDLTAWRGRVTDLRYDT